MRLQVAAFALVLVACQSEAQIGPQAMADLQNNAYSCGKAQAVLDFHDLRMAESLPAWDIAEHFGATTRQVEQVRGAFERGYQRGIQTMPFEPNDNDLLDLMVWYLANC